MVSSTYFLSLLFTTASAIEYFGSGNPGLRHDEIKPIFEDIEANNSGLTISHVFAGGALEGNSEFGKFLSAGNFTSGRAYDRYAPQSANTENKAIFARAYTVCENKGLISLNKDVTFAVCTALATIVGAGNVGLAVIAKGAFCHPGSGETSNCNLLWTFTFGGSGILTVAIVNQYCPKLLSDTYEICEMKSGDSQSNGNELLFDISQTRHSSCGEVIIDCTTVGPN
jgi:hypothetical protein